jgi:hypothetical protein
LGWEAWAHAEEEQRSQRTAGKWIAIIACSAVLVIAGLIAIAKLL